MASLQERLLSILMCLEGCIHAIFKLCRRTDLEKQQEAAVDAVLDNIIPPQKLE